MNISQRLLATGAMSFALMAFSANTAQAATMSLLGNLCGGNAAATCVDFAQVYGTDNVTGGAVVDPAIAKTNTYAIPGSNTNGGAAAAQVTSFNLTSSLNDPVGATSPITVSSLEGAFDLYWGSVDTYNKIEFFLVGSSAAMFTGTDVATEASRLDSLTANGNYNFDQYVRFTGEFDTAVLSIIPGFGSGIAFEVAVAVPVTVPEPSIIAMLGLGLLGFGLMRFPRRQS